MDYTKQAEQSLKDYNIKVTSIKLLPQILRKNKIEIYAIEKALNKLDARDKELIQRICINGENPKDMEKEKGISWRRIYKQKESALEKFTKMMYGTKICDEEGNNNE